MTEYYKNHSHFEEIMTASKSESTEQKTGEDGDFIPEMVSDELMADAISFVEASAKAESDCEVCVYVMENKEQHQPYLCRGLKTPSQQQAVSMMSLSNLCFFYFTLTYLSLVRLYTRVVNVVA